MGTQLKLFEVQSLTPRQMEPKPTLWSNIYTNFERTEVYEEYEWHHIDGISMCYTRIYDLRKAK